MTNWDKKFMRMAYEVARWSKDESTKCGSVIVYDNAIVSSGYNGMCIGINDNVPERHERPMKYRFFEHSERNGIFLAAKRGAKTEGCTIYIATIGNDLFCCSDCARAIIQSGIKRIVIKQPDWENERWKEDCKIAKEMLDECDIKIDFYE